MPVVLTVIYIPSFVHPVSTLMVGQWLGGKTLTREWISIDDISPVLVHSVMMSEDGRFCSHHGVDWREVGNVFEAVVDGEKPRGASTLSMQVVKNLYLWPGRSYLRKALEVPLALMVDLIWSKKRTMEIYLNIAEWGPGIFGIEAASRHHFKRSAKRLSRRQAALLAVTLPNPIKRNPARPRRKLAKHGRLIERRARQAGAYVKCVK